MGGGAGGGEEVGRVMQGKIVSGEWVARKDTALSVKIDPECPKGGEHDWRFLREVETGYGKKDQFYCTKCRKKEADTQ